MRRRRRSKQDRSGKLGSGRKGAREAFKWDGRGGTEGCAKVKGAEGFRQVSGRVDNSAGLHRDSPGQMRGILLPTGFKIKL